MPKILENFPEELKEMTAKKLTLKNKTLLYQQLGHVFFRAGDL